jgi:hypothetical protein
VLRGSSGEHGVRETGATARQPCYGFTETDRKEW